MDLAKPTALELKWRAREEESTKLIARLDGVMDELMGSLSREAGIDAVRASLAKLGPPLRTLHADHSESFFPAFGRAVQRLCGERAAVSEQCRGDDAGSLPQKIAALKEKMVLLVDFFDHHAKEKRVALDRSDLTEALTFLVSGPDGAEKFAPVIQRSGYTAELSPEFARRDSELRTKLTAAFSSNERIFKAVTPELATEVTNEGARRRIFDETVTLIAAAYGVPKPAIHFAQNPDIRALGTPAVLILRTYAIHMDTSFEFAKPLELPSQTFLIAQRISRHAIQAYLGKSSARNDETPVEPCYQTDCALAREFPADARALRLALLARVVPGFPRASEVLFTAKSASLIDSDASRFSDQLLDELIDSLEAAEKAAG